MSHEAIGSGRRGREREEEEVGKQSSHGVEKGEEGVKRIEKGSGCVYSHVGYY